MKYFLEDEEITLEELEEERDKWEQNSGGYDHRVIVLDYIENNYMYFFKMEYEC